MNGRKKRSSKASSRSKKQTSQRTERNNFQDEAEIREFDKGFEDGKKFCGRKVKPATNDPQWYFKDKTILNDVASFSFSQPLGSRLNLRSYFNEGHGIYSKYSVAIPGVMSLMIAPTIGISEDAQSPINLAATNVYSYVRYKNSGNANYDAPDLMIYLIAMDSIYACWNWLKRIYGMASTYSQTNRYAPRAWLSANCIDFNDLMANLADFRGWLNMKANEIASFCVPATMTYMVRHSWLFSNVYTDGDTDKAQQYLYVPAFFYKYNEMSSPAGGLLEPVPVCWTEEMTTLNGGNRPSYTVAELEAILDGMLEVANYSEDIGIMSGDILKAYERGGLFTLSTIDPDYRVEPVYSREVLSQIENATLAPLTEGVYNSKIGSKLSDWTIFQDPNTNWIKFAPTFTSIAYGIPGQVCNFHWNNPTPEDVMVATRLKSTWSYSDGNSTLTSCGSELLLWVTLWTNIENQDGNSKIISDAVGSGPLSLYGMDICGSIYPGTDGTTPEALLPWQWATMIWNMMALSAFDWHPAVAVVVPQGDTASAGWCSLGYLIDFDKYTLLDDQDIESMNLLALLTEYNVPN